MKSNAFEVLNRFVLNENITTLTEHSNVSVLCYFRRLKARKEFFCRTLHSYKMLSLKYKLSESNAFSRASLTVETVKENGHAQENDSVGIDDVPP